MTTQEVKRKLTAILSADVKGYSRLMGEDEESTARTLNTYKEVMAGLVQHHHGRVVDAPGDNVLAEFASVVDAVRCAVEIQKELKTRNVELRENRRMEFRIGINLGDVIEEGDKILGDGVNIAARMESLSEAGGICISGTAYDQVENKLSLGYEYLGEQAVKNIAKPVRVYRVLMEPEAAGKVISEKKAKPRQWKSAAIGLMVFVIIVIAVIVIWKLYTPPLPQPEVASKEKITAAPSEKPPATIPTPPAPPIETTPKEKVTPPLPEKVTKPTPPPVPKMEVASKDKMAFPLPEKPSIAVLPFVNMSGDPKKDYLSDGITEEIINALSKIPSVFVIARNSTFTYKGKPVKVQQVSEEMGVQYVMEGSVQWSGDRVRITVQLIDALKGHHLFSERYDRELKDIFALQDEITKKALMAMRVALRGDDAGAYASEKGTKNLDAYLKLLQAWEHMNVMNKDRMALARPLVEEALALDPGNAFAYAALAHVTILEVYVGASKSPRESLDRAEELAKKALALDDSNYYPYTVLSLTYRFKKQFDKAISSAEKAVALSPNSALACFMLGAALYGSERFEEAIPYLNKSLRLSPIPIGQCLYILATTYRFLGRYDEAIAIHKKLLQREPDYLPAHVGLAATYVLAGRQEEARAEAAEVMRIDPQFSLERYTKTWPLRQELIDQSVEALRKAGLK
jgi:TolB-like protein/class 3 adenylate cyclase/cytochrome c-type biogenesis protein CcmH/NrfG